MTMRKRSEAVLAGVACAVLLFGSSLSMASVIDLRNAAREETSLIHHYTFEGTQTDSKNLRTLDRAGTLDLREHKNLTLSNVVFETGFDALSMGGTGVHVTNSIGSGAGWVSTNPIALPATLTVECLVCPRGVPGYDDTFLVSSKDLEKRGYFLIQTKSLKFQLRVGALAAKTILEPYVTNHWYYVVSTYAVSGGATTVNCYYVDLTAGGDLQHPIVNSVVNDTYGNGAILGVGCLYSGNPSYFAPCAIDEVAMYDTVFSAEKISAHLAELRRELPALEYRELFPNDVNTAERDIVLEGWKTYQGTNGNYFAAVKTVNADTAFLEDLPAIASLPQDTGVTEGYLNNHSGPTNQNYLYWTGEMTNRLDVGWLKMVTFDTRSAKQRTLRLALRVDTNATPAEVGDDAWFVGADFDNEAGTSVLAIPAALSELATAWRRHWVELASGEWAALSFVPETSLVLGEVEAALPTNGLVTAFGLFQDYHEYKMNMRIDNFTIYARREYPPPPPKGTLFFLE